MPKFYTEHDRRIPQTPDEPFPTPGFFPATAVLVSVADPDTGVPNIIPLIGWGPLNRDPLMMGIAVCVREYNRDYYVRGSNKFLRRSMDFVLNIPTKEQKDLITRCGELSRAKDPKVNKFSEVGFTPGPGRRIKSPHIVECPVNYECVIRAILPMGSHDLYIGEVVGCFTDGEVVSCDTLFGNDRYLMKLDGGGFEMLTWTTLMEREYLTEGESGA